MPAACYTRCWCLWPGGGGLQRRCSHCHSETKGYQKYWEATRFITSKCNKSPVEDEGISTSLQRSRLLSWYMKDEQTLGGQRQGEKRRDVIMRSTCEGQEMRKDHQGRKLGDVQYGCAIQTYWKSGVGERSWNTRKHRLQRISYVLIGNGDFISDMIGKRWSILRRGDKIRFEYQETLLITAGKIVRIYDNSKLGGYSSNLAEQCWHLNFQRAMDRFRRCSDGGGGG